MKDNLKEIIFWYVLVRMFNHFLIMQQFHQIHQQLVDKQIQLIPLFQIKNVN
jgi:hypothetical protein